MKKQVKLAAIAAALMGLVGAASAAQVTSPAGLTFTVGAACTVQGAVADLGNYSTGQNATAFYTRNGYQDGDAGWTVTAGSVQNTMATVNCPNGTPWTLHINGDGWLGLQYMNAAVGGADFPLFAYATAVGGAALPAPLDIKANTAGLAGTGTGSNQIVTGSYGVVSWAGGPDTPMQEAAAKIMAAGTWSAATTAVLDF